MTYTIEPEESERVAHPFPEGNEPKALTSGRTYTWLTKQNVWRVYNGLGGVVGVVVLGTYFFSDNRIPPFEHLFDVGVHALNACVGQGSHPMLLAAKPVLNGARMFQIVMEESAGTSTIDRGANYFDLLVNHGLGLVL
jgi:hypothetical protein